jgi:hypothetical protein
MSDLGNGGGGGGGGGGNGYDTNVDNYSISELLGLVGLDGVSQIQENEFSNIISGLVEKYRNVDSNLSRFFADVGQRIYNWLNTSLEVGRGDRRDDDDDDEWEVKDGGADGRGREGLSMRNVVSGGAGGGAGGGADGGEEAGGGGYDDQMGGVGSGGYGGDGGGEGGGSGSGDSNDIMGLKRDANRGLVSGDQQLKWERNQYLDDGDDDGGGGGGGGNGLYVNRKNKVKIFRDVNDHYQMKQKKIGVASSYNVPLAQGTTNPILRNTLTRIINIDSQFRQSVFPYTTDPTSPTSATSFTVVLTEPLTNVTSLKLNSINIPYTWYTVDSAVGNNIMYIDMNTGVNGVHTVTVANGNYSPAELVAAVRRQIGLNLYLYGNIDISYNTVNGHCFLMNYTSKVISFTFYDAALIYAGKTAGGCRQSTKLNNSLGWLLGFRNSNFYDEAIMANGALPSGYDRTLNTFDVYGMVYMVLGVGEDMVLKATTGEATVPEQVALSISGLYSDNNPANDASAGVGWVRGEAIVDCYGPQYFLLIIDDFNHSRVNSGVVGIGEVTTSLARPIYFNAGFPDVCVSDVADVRNGIKKQKLTVPLVPRTLTFSQIYTLNQITANRGGGSGISGKNREMGPKTSDVFAVIPLRTTVGLTLGQHYIDYGPSLLTNQRAYFGPVVINKLRVTLRDDKGYIVNLHGNDWSFSLVTEELYEF